MSLLSKDSWSNNSQLSDSEPVSSVIGACAQTIHALRILRSHGMCSEALQHAYKSVVTNAASASWHLLLQPIVNTYKRPSDAASDLDCAIPASQLWLSQLTLLMKHFLNVLFITQTMYCTVSVAASAVHYNSQPSSQTPQQNITGQANTST